MMASDGKGDSLLQIPMRGHPLMGTMIVWLSYSVLGNLVLVMICSRLKASNASISSWGSRVSPSLGVLFGKNYSCVAFWFVMLSLDLLKSSHFRRHLLPISRLLAPEQHSNMQQQYARGDTDDTKFTNHSSFSTEFSNDLLGTVSIWIHMI